MSGGNAERFHRIYEEWNERRRLGPDLLADDAEWINPSDAVEPGSRQGAESFNQAIASVFEGWEDSRFEVDRVEESGHDVIALGHIETRGRLASIGFHREHGQIWTFRDGRAVRMRWFNSHEEALAAAGGPE
jgi:ketosteroid isomerase-like protein